MKTKRFLLAVIFGFALAFTFSCSSDDGDKSSGGSDVFSSLPTQVYLEDGKKFTGSGDIEFVFKNSWELVLPVSVGTIQNGKITLDLPKTIPDKYLTALDDSFYSFENSTVQGEAKITSEAWLRAIIDGEECYLGLVGSTGEIWREAEFVYSSGSGKITGTRYIQYKGSSIYNINLSKGWNLIYSEGKECDECQGQVSTDSKIITGELNWEIGCY